jgi:hypothetical protein
LQSVLPRRARNHPIQIQQYHCPARFDVNPAGRRSGKTLRSKYKLVNGTPHHPGALTKEGGRFFYGAPTHNQAKRIAWKDLKTLTGPAQQGKPSEGELVITLKNGTELHVVGLDEPARIEGIQWDGFILDEYANTKRGMWPEHLQAITSDTDAWANFIGVPDFRGTNGQEYKELRDKALTGDDPAWSTHTWKSEDVLKAAAIAQAKRDLALNIYLQEYEASFEDAPGRAYTAFNKLLHVPIGGVAYIRDIPVLVSLDFNHGHHNWGLYQFSAIQNCYRAFDQVYEQSATVETMCASLAAKCREYGIDPGTLQFFGDYSGVAHRAEATWSAWEQVKQAFPAASYHYQVSGPIADRMNLTNAWLQNAAGECRTQIDPRCTQLIKDLEYVTSAMLFSGAKSGDLTHASDNFGYLLVQHTTTATLDMAGYASITSSLRI